ncbi:MAG: TlpA family protein disulfide reductase [Gemmatimonadota bacterium]|nr:TlpA family protein disulfide reductase [Gemmatimonadota bacterium]
MSFLKGAEPGVSRVATPVEFGRVLIRRGARACAVGAALVWAPVGAGAQDVALPVGTVAPAAAVQDLDGNAVELLDVVAGRPAVIEFWASWCENCEALQPQMDRIHSEYGDRVQVVAVAVAVSQSVRRVKRHLEEHDPGYPFLWDATGAAVRAYRAPTTSVVIILDGEGKVAYTGSGGAQDLLGALRGVLDGN